MGSRLRCLRLCSSAGSAGMELLRPGKRRVLCPQLSSPWEHLSSAWVLQAAQHSSPEQAFAARFCPPTSLMGWCISSAFAWEKGCSEPVLETGIRPRPPGRAGNAQPAGAWHPSREIVLLSPIMRAFREGLYNMNLFFHYRTPQPPHFFQQVEQKRKGEKSMTLSVSTFRGGKELLYEKRALKRYETCRKEHFSNATLFAH